MAPVTRKNVLRDQKSLNDYVRGVGLLKQRPSGRYTSEFNIPGPMEPISLYDIFVLWHILTGDSAIPPGGDPMRRNQAHRGPTFLPWHRRMLNLFEANLRFVLNDSAFALPYWDWTADGDSGSPFDAPVWRPGCMGGQGDPVSSGPFAFHANDPNTFSVHIETDAAGNPSQPDRPRGLVRDFGRSEPDGWPTLPTSGDMKAALTYRPSGPHPKPEDGYDTLTYDVDSDGFRSRVEGWLPASRPWMHNQVHMWVGGDMVPMSSPNDPVFYLHHCNVDRIWEARIERYDGRVYAPDMTAPADPYLGIRIDDQLGPPAAAGDTPRRMLGWVSSEHYVYDTLP
ncbi:tyrosinase family protein [Streptomyces tagetis]|uniref:Tyrosinase family protein n=1 Tax=Streptomyces tagetis TaxID=2820809 RepID=A0A941B1A9_9ACTN|nr:tyrosinase family protein [Streptomyces sp. RG38]MBQ0825927.1 tyrosinase family protein [Streptomyces sp. RG38]